VQLDVKKSVTNNNISVYSTFLSLSLTLARTNARTRARTHPGHNTEYPRWQNVGHSPTKVSNPGIHSGHIAARSSFVLGQLPVVSPFNVSPIC